MRETVVPAIVALLTLIGAPGAEAADVHAAVAANFLGTFRIIVRPFERDTGHRVIVSAGSSGQLYNQIMHGAPYDLFLSADKKRPEALETNGKAAPGSRFTYAAGKLALYSAREGFVDGEGAVLRTRAFKRLAVANPKTAPYGLAARQALVNMGIFEAVRPMIVEGLSVSQAYQFVASGAAELGLVALSQVKENAQAGGSFWLVPRSLYDPIEQQAALLRHGAGNEAARALLDYLKSGRAKTIIRRFGYDAPDH